MLFRSPRRSRATLLRHMAVSVLAAVLLSACATSYQSHGATGGYTDKKLSDSAYIVSFSGNGFATKDRVYYFWVYRCAELTLQSGYALFSIRANPQTGMVAPQSGLRPAVYRPDDAGQMVKTRSGGVVVTPVPGGGGSVTAWSYSGTVLMYPKPLPGELVWAVDAQAVITALKPYVDSDGKSPAPTRAELFTRVFVAHERITFPGDFSVANSPDEGEKPVRPAQEISESVQNEHRVALHTAFRDLEKRTGTRSGPGQVVLDFSVSPNGEIMDCKVSSSTYPDHEFITAVTGIVQHSQFGPQDVGAAHVENFRIAFAPM